MTETLATRARLLQAALATAAEDAVYYDPDGSAYTSMAHADVVEMRAVLDALTAAMTGATAEELRAFLSEEADAAVEAEREACAVLIESLPPAAFVSATGIHIAQAIRARTAAPATKQVDWPWSDLKVAFDLEDDDALWVAYDADELALPDGWELCETDCSGARSVAVFRVDHAPSIAEGGLVVAALRSCTAAPATTTPTTEAGDG